MSTTDNNSTVYIEFPDFGFGPASTSASLIAYLLKFRRCKIISTGVALNFVRSIYPQIEFFDINTSDKDALDRVSKSVPRNSTIISNTNPGFALWASMNGYKVSVVDTLFWMWGLLPDILENVNLYIIQNYFGHDFINSLPTNFDAKNLVYVKPIINFERWDKKIADDPSNDILIAFGGMGNPFDSTFEKEYATWILDAILPILLSHKSIQNIHVVGGEIKKDLLDRNILNSSSNFIIHGIVTPDDYSRLVKSSKFHLITPGLTSIYESVIAGISPLFLPGSNVSQIIQSVHLSKFANYKHITFWSKSDEIFDAITSVSEEAGIEIVIESLRTIMKYASENQLVASQLHKYLSVSDQEENFVALSKLSESWKDLPTIEEVLSTYLSKLIL